jgi:hypothetical protein
MAGISTHALSAQHPCLPPSVPCLSVRLCLWLVCVSVFVAFLLISVCLSCRSHNPRLAASHHTCTCDTAQP